MRAYAGGERPQAPKIDRAACAEAQSGLRFCPPLCGGKGHCARSLSARRKGFASAVIPQPTKKERNPAMNDIRLLHTPQWQLSGTDWLFVVGNQTVAKLVPNFDKTAPAASGFRSSTFPTTRITAGMLLTLRHWNPPRPISSSGGSRCAEAKRSDHEQGDRAGCHRGPPTYHNSRLSGLIFPNVGVIKKIILKNCAHVRRSRKPANTHRLYSCLATGDRGREIPQVARSWPHTEKRRPIWPELTKHPSWYA